MLGGAFVHEPRVGRPPAKRRKRKNGASTTLPITKKEVSFSVVAYLRTGAFALLLAGKEE